MRSATPSRWLSLAGFAVLVLGPGWVLTRDLARVTYSPLAPRQADFDLVRDLMLETGLSDRPIPFAEYVDPRFADGAAGARPWVFTAASTTAQ